MMEVNWCDISIISPNPSCLYSYTGNVPLVFCHIWIVNILVTLCFFRSYWYKIDGCQLIVCFSNFSPIHLQPLFLYLPYQAVHGPLQVPEYYSNQYKSINDTNRRIYAGMVTCMDEGIGNITQTLHKLGMWKDTIMIFSTGITISVLFYGVVTVSFTWLKHYMLCKTERMFCIRH